MQAIAMEADSINPFHDTLVSSFAKVVESILQSRGKVIITGVRKSWDRSKTKSSALSSTDTPAIFLNPTRDTGLICSKNVIIAVGKSRESEILEKVKKAIAIEVDAIKHFQDTLDPNFARAVELILQSKGKVIVTGVGKSGDIAKKISSTLSSTGTPAIFLHPTDSAHGDAGLIGSEDVIIAIGKSGESDELIALIPTIKKLGTRLIGITANPISRLALACDVTLITPILQEACPLALAPTSSTTITLIAGDAIAMALMELKNFHADDFALFHPAGRLGKRLSLDIEDVMRSGEDNAMVNLDADLAAILNEITVKRLGAVGVVDLEGLLVGFITDCEIRFFLAKASLTKDTTAREIMNPNPSAFGLGLKAYDVLVAMEDRNRPISVAPIVDSENRLVGIVLIHDLLQRGL